LGLVVAVTVSAFWPTWLSFIQVWGRYNYGHGYLILGVVGWLLWRQRGVLVASTSRASDLIPFIAIASLGWLLAFVMGLGVVHQGLMVLVLLAWGIAAFGWSAGRALAPLAATFLLAVPLWEVLIPVLRSLTVLVSGNAAGLLGIQAEVQEFNITIPEGTFIIDQGCSGLAFLLSGLSLGATYALVFVRRWPVQVAIVAGAAAISIVSNWVRVLGLIVIGHTSSMEADVLRDHGAFGWTVFVVGLVPTYFVARRLQRLDRDPEAEGEAPGTRGTAAEGEAGYPGTRGTAAEGEAGYPGEARYPGETSSQAEAQRDDKTTGASMKDPPWRRALAPTAAAVVGPILFMTVGVVPRGGPPDLELERLGLAPTLAATEIGPETPAGWDLEYSGVDERRSWTATVSETLVRIDRFVFLDQRPGEELIQDGNRIAPDSALAGDRYMGPLPPRGRIVREALVRTSGAPLLVWYWYRVAGIETSSPLKAKFLEALSFFLRHPASELVTLSAPCRSDNCTDAANALLGLIGGPEGGFEPPPGDSTGAR
jgi:exosortase